MLSFIHTRLFANFLTLYHCFSGKAEVNYGAQMAQYDDFAIYSDPLYQQIEYPVEKQVQQNVRTRFIHI